MYKIKDILKNKKFRLLLILGVVVLLISFFVRGCSQSMSLVYKYHKVDKGRVQKTVSVSGKLELDSFVIVESKISGIISNIYTDFNKEVKKGQILAKIESESIDEDIASYAETYKRARISLETKKEYYESKKRLFQENLISKKEMLSSERSYKVALSTFRQTKMTYDKYIQQQRDKKIVATTSGVIIQSWAEERKKVGAGTDLFMIAPSLKIMKLIINIDEADIGLVKEGQRVTFSVSAHPKEIFEGKIKQVRMNPITKGGIVTYESLVMCNNSKMLLKPGMSATAVVHISTLNNVLRLPKQAFAVSPVELELKPGEIVVWRSTSTIDQTKVKKIPVKIGLEGDEYNEIKPGKIKVGDKILIGIHKKLETKDSINAY